ncbi:MAG: hypothetical protein H6Q86_5155, partial [candidate division NC10 bacterium]|nr:hypothetical protein [candidate division NC10 bacterium]
LTLLFVFIRVLPMISIFEMRTVLPSPKSRPAPVPGAAPAGD